MARCDSCGRDRETVGHGGRQLCLACLRAGGVPAAPAGVVAPEAAAAGTRVPRKGMRPVCYLIVGPGRFDDWAIPVNGDVPLFARVKEFLAEEDLGCTFETFFDGGDPQLGPDDVAVIVRVTEYDLGDRLVRSIPLLRVVGACKLAVDVHIRRGGGGSTAHHLRATRASGGSGVRVMDANFRAIAAKIAGKVAGRKLLNITVYNLALASLIVGLGSFIPFLGIFLAVSGMTTGVIAVAAIRARGLPRRMGTAVAGICLSFFGAVVSLGLARSMVAWFR